MILNSLTVNEMDRMLSILSIEKLEEYKTKLINECKDLAVKFIQDAPSPLSDVVKEKYEFKMAVVMRAVAEHDIRLKMKR